MLAPLALTPRRHPPPATVPLPTTPLRGPLGPSWLKLAEIVRWLPDAPLWSSAPLRFDDTAALHAAIQALYEWIDATRFPVELNYLDYYDEYEWWEGSWLHPALCGFYPGSVGEGPCCDPAGWGEPFGFLSALYAPPPDSHHTPLAAYPAVAGRSIRTQGLAGRVAAQPLPSELRALPKILALYESRHEIWCPCEFEESQAHPWTPNALTDFAALWQEAMALRDDCAALAAWVQRDQPARLVQLAARLATPAPRRHKQKKGGPP